MKTLFEWRISSVRSPVIPVYWFYSGYEDLDFLLELRYAF